MVLLALLLLEGLLGLLLLVVLAWKTSRQIEDSLSCDFGCIIVVSLFLGYSVCGGRMGTSCGSLESSTTIPPFKEEGEEGG